MDTYKDYVVPVGVTRVIRSSNGVIKDIRVGSIPIVKGISESKVIELAGGVVTGKLVGYATESWVEGKGYITVSSLSGYATQAWVQQQGYLTSQFWTRDAVNGYLYPTTIGDKVGIGTNTPIKNLDIVGLQAAIGLKGTENTNEASVGMYNNASRYMVSAIYGSTRAGTEIPGVNKAGLAHISAWATNMLIHAISGDLIFANSGIESFRIKANNTWLFKGGVTKLEYTPGNIPVFNSRLIISDNPGLDYTPEAQLTLSTAYSYQAGKNIGLSIKGSRANANADSYGCKVYGISLLSTNQYMYGYASGQTIIPTYPGGTIIDFLSNSELYPATGSASYVGFKVSTYINQTGTASGKTVGLLIEPNIVNAVNWRSIEWNNSSGYGLYGVGTAKNYLNGRLGLKTDTPTRDLDINGTLRVRTLADGSGAAYTKVLVADTDGNVDAINKSTLASSDHTHSGVSGTFTTNNGMTITITNGIVTNIVE